MKKTELRNDGTLCNQLEVGDIVEVIYLDQDDQLSGIGLGDQLKVTKINDYLMYNKLSIEVEVGDGFWDMYNSQLEFISTPKIKKGKKKAKIKELKVEITSLKLELAHIKETLDNLIN